MIISGWILQDLYEVKCKSCSTLNGHIDVVKRYLDNLKLKDRKTYDKIVTAFYNESAKLPTLGLDDFAVMKLGWIKVNNVPMNVIFYIDSEDSELATMRYLRIGYSSVVLDELRPIIPVYIASKELI